MKTIFLFIAMLSYSMMYGQLVNDFNKVTIALDDGTKVTLYGKAGSIGDRTASEVLEGYKPKVKEQASRFPWFYPPEKDGGSSILHDAYEAKDDEYYYLPTNLRLSKNDNGIPQFLLLKYMTDEETPDRDMSGALMHFLMEWGLTEKQKEEATDKLSQLKGKKVKIVGPLEVTAPAGESFQITSATASDPSLNNTGLIATGSAPVIEGGKVAVASNFNKYGAQLIGASFEKESGESSVSDMSVTLAFSYTTKIPAFKGRVIFDWEKFASNGLKDTTSQTVEKTNWWIAWNTWGIYGKSGENTNISKQELFDSLSQAGVVTMELEENYSDERVDVIREGVMDIFMNSINTLFQDALAQESTDDDVRYDDDAERNRSTADVAQQEFVEAHKDDNYTAIKHALRETSKKGTQILELSYSLPKTQTFTITENIMSWYDEIDRYNEACISKVILNDPFFQRLRIQFVLDRDMVDIFEQEVNYATVNVRKKRNDGHDFTSRLTLDQKYVTENGVQAAMTYAAGNDKNPDMYEYQVQYSFRGGNVFPENPRWQKGTMEAVTLYPPIKMHNIEFESDLTTLTEYDIARATMQVRYMKLNAEHQVNIPVSPAKGEPIASKAIFMDENMKGFAYRIIYDHKTEGKLATEWNAKLGAIDYLYAPIPEEFRDKQSELFKQAKELGSNLAPADSKEGKVANTVIETFKVLFE